VSDAIMTRSLQYYDGGSVKPQRMKKGGEPKLAALVSR
jgi:hypothetical protein